MGLTEAQTPREALSAGLVRIPGAHLAVVEDGDDSHSADDVAQQRSCQPRQRVADAQYAVDRRPEDLGRARDRVVELEEADKEADGPDNDGLTDRDLGGLNEPSNQREQPAGHDRAPEVVHE